MIFTSRFLYIKTISVDGESINIIGVEYWSASRRFQQYGKLDVAYGGLNKNEFKLLMSHNPSHWNAHVTSNFKDIDLTLSGHTHGLQYGIDIGKFRSYEARRTLDRMIGYEISPKVRDLGGAFISTGRVQGPAIRLIVEREEERLKFVKSKYFEIKALCKSNDYEFTANLKRVSGKRLASSSDFNEKGNSSF